MCHKKEVESVVLKACNALGKKNGFKTLELLEAVILTPDEWTPESGLVTAAQKIQRKKIAEAFAKEIKVRLWGAIWARSLIEGVSCLSNGTLYGRNG